MAPPSECNILHHIQRKNKPQIDYYCIAMIAHIINHFKYNYYSREILHERIKQVRYRGQISEMVEYDGNLANLIEIINYPNGGIKKIHDLTIRRALDEDNNDVFETQFKDALRSFIDLLI